MKLREPKLKIWTEDIEPEAFQQLRNIAQLPFVHHTGIAVMPDVHAGIGATVGSVIPTQGAIIPAAVGVDIGCGMTAIRTSLAASDLPDSLSPLRAAIEKVVPVGVGKGGEHKDRDDWFITDRIRALGELPHFFDDEEHVVKAHKQLGTLGGGNHFIEICLDRLQRVWIMLHSGSRGIGNQIGRFYIEQARKLAEKYFINLPDRDLAYLAEGTTEFDNYVAAVGWAQDYAARNREVMMAEVVGALQSQVSKPFTYGNMAINCHHNYIVKENHFGANLWITRKGAIRAREGDLGIIPGSMGQRSYIVLGRGNAESLCSCSHGAGRRMSRTKARNHFSVDDLQAQTQGVECRKDAGVLDEIPGAYKDIDVVMENQRDLVDVIAVLKQVVCVKG